MNLKTFETEIRNRVSAVEHDGVHQWPRPWFTDLLSPLDAEVFIVGANQRTVFPLELIGEEEHLDSLFNRNARTCERMYLTIRKGGKPSLTRKRIYELLTTKLRAEGVSGIVETNVKCVSSAQYRDLLPQHMDIGGEIFDFLLKVIRPKYLIQFGSGCRSDFAKAIAATENIKSHKPLLELLEAAVPKSPDQKPRAVEFAGFKIFPIPGLVQGGWNPWRSWADDYTTLLARQIACDLKGSRP